MYEYHVMKIGVQTKTPGELTLSSLKLEPKSIMLQ